MPENSGEYSWSHHWISEVLEDIIRYCMEHGLFDIATHLSDALRAIDKRNQNDERGTQSSGQVTLHLALEACLHLSHALGFEDVSEALSKAIRLMEDHDHRSNIVQIGVRKKD